MVSYFCYWGTGRISTFFCYLDERVVYKEGGFPYYFLTFRIISIKQAAPYSVRIYYSVIQLGGKKN